MDEPIENGLIGSFIIFLVESEKECAQQVENNLLNEYEQQYTHNVLN